MADTLTFEALLAAAAEDDTEKLEAELQELKAERVELRDQLQEVEGRIRGLESQLAVPVSKAVRAARELGIEVPDEHQRVRTSTSRRSSGKYIWHCDGLKTMQQEVSRAMWRLSRGSGGSGGNNGEGTLLVDEFWALVKEQTGSTEYDIEPGDKVTVKLPNDREVTFERVEE